MSTAYSVLSAIGIAQSFSVKRRHSAGQMARKFNHCNSFCATTSRTSRHNMIVAVDLLQHLSLQSCSHDDVYIGPPTTSRAFVPLKFAPSKSIDKFSCDQFLRFYGCNAANVRPVCVTT